MRGRDYRLKIEGEEMYPIELSCFGTSLLILIVLNALYIMIFVDLKGGMGRKAAKEIATKFSCQRSGCDVKCFSCKKR